MTERADESYAAPGVRLSRGLLVFEVLVVLGLSLGRSGIYSIVDIIASATAPGPLRNQGAVLNSSKAPGRPLLDLTLQLLGIGFGLVPVLLVIYLLHRSGTTLRAIGVDGDQRARDVRRGVAIAAAVGSAGLAWYLVTHALGVDLTVVASDLPSVWWRYPVLMLSAMENALLEEFVVIGYLLLRLRELGLTSRWAVVVASLVRGSYHLYQGVGGFVGNIVMGLFFGWVYLRWGRLWPLVVAHTILDIASFIGYALLAGHVSWLPSL